MVGRCGCSAWSAWAVSAPIAPRISSASAGLKTPSETRRRIFSTSATLTSSFQSPTCLVHGDLAALKRTQDLERVLFIDRLGLRCHRRRLSGGDAAQSDIAG